MQYQNTLRDLFGSVRGFDALSAAQAGLARLPPDDAGSDFKGLDARLSDRHAQGYYDVADALATALTGDDARLRTLATACALERAPAATCVDRFLDQFAARAYRRPLTSAERARYAALDDGSRDGRELFRSMIFTLLMSPPFLYHLEVDGTGTGSTFALSTYALASRLSFHFWQTIPDDALWAAAADGSLSTDAGYEEQVRRLFESPRTAETVSAFYREWLQLGAISSFRRTPGFDAFAADVGLDDPSADHLAAAAQEIEDLAQHFTFQTEGTLRDLLLTDVTLNRSPHLARLYGVPAWDGSSPHVRLPSGERAGLLTRVGFLVSGTQNTHPIHRGAVVRRRLMCQELVAPDPGSLPPGSLVPPPVDASQTTRERFANKVQSQTCAGCHAQMNPIGYVLERYDALGRHRDRERIYDDMTGDLLNELPVDSRAKPQIGGDRDREMETGVELSQALAESGAVEPCFARQYFRFTYRRAETAADSCALEGVRVALTEGNLRQAFMAIALDPNFKTRKVE